MRILSLLFISAVSGGLLLETAFAGFSKLDIREHESAIAEGTHHVGMSALIDVVAVK